jgi:transposase
MQIQKILQPVTRDHLKGLPRQQLIELLLGEQSIREQALARMTELEEEKYLINEKYVLIKNKLFMPSSEKSALDKQPRPRKTRKQAGNRTLKPSERYSNVAILEQEIELSPSPPCPCCGEEMVDSGMVESSESLSIIPKKYVIKRQNRHKYHCRGCRSGITTAPAIPRIKPGSSYDDDFIVDVALSKYCDLIPIERYAAIARRGGFPGLPPQSLIELTHYLAEFLLPVVALIKEEILEAEVLHADETPHLMLEGDAKKNWYLWGFSSLHSSYFECQNTRSGDVASEILKSARCRFLVSDIYSGYNKAVRCANDERRVAGRGEIFNAYCNAHSRRKFREIPGDAGAAFVEDYRRIYQIEAETKDDPLEGISEKRQQIRPIMEDMRVQAKQLLLGVSSRSQAAKAANYFINNYDGLSLFLDHPEIPIDNNHEERQLRSHVVGRKTWYGTHSRNGARTASVMFTVVESCKINGLNPRKYIADLVRNIHQGNPPYSPRQAALRKNDPETG